MKHPWSKLQKELYNLIDPKLDLQIHCVVYPMRSQRGSTDLPRYWITLAGETIWDFPKDFVIPEWNGSSPKLKSLGDGLPRRYYPYNPGISDISAFLREYIDTPPGELYGKHFPSDAWGLANILKAADRRIGKRRLPLLRRKTGNAAARKVIDARLAELAVGDGGVEPAEMP